MLKFISTALVSVSFIGAAIAAPTPGDALPDFTETTITGETITDESLADKLVVFEWTNHDCPFVKKHYDSGNMQSTQEAAIAQDVTWISVISSAPGKQGHVDAEKATSLSIKRGATPTHIILDEDGSLGQLFAAKTTPHMYIADRGTVKYNGAIDSLPSASKSDIEKADNYVLAALTSIKAGQDVAVDTSKPYGCSVKY